MFDSVGPGVGGGINKISTVILCPAPVGLQEMSAKSC